MADFDEDEEDYVEPQATPDDVALAIIQGLVVGLPADQDLQAVIARAWTAVPHYFVWRQKYAEIFAPMFLTPIRNITPDEN